MHAHGGPSKASASKLKCPDGRSTFYEGYDSNIAVCSNCHEKRKAHKLPSITGPVSPHHKQQDSKSAMQAPSVPMQLVDNSDMMRPVSRTLPPRAAPNHTEHTRRPLPHWKTWFECIDAAGQPVGTYVSATRSQRELPELPLPVGWIADIDPRYSATFYVNRQTSSSQWQVPLPRFWEERRNPDGDAFYVRGFPDAPETAQFERPLTFAFCPHGHPLRSYCDR